MRVRPLALLALLLALALPARAADLSGVWVIDQAAWQAQLDRTVAAMLRQMPPEALARLRARGGDPAQALRAAASQGLDGTIEFLPDGHVRTVTPKEGSDERSSWQLDGSKLRVKVADAEGIEALVGQVADDRITLRPILRHTTQRNAFMADLIYPLVRRGTAPAR
ncbi:MAG: hypothetical protein U1E17_16670 [Geminicoccaceae bacterium]